MVESLQRQAELTTDRQRARTLRMEVASVYEKELAGPERAIEAYEAILAEMPEDEEALAALDRLDETHGRFEDLAEILGKRAAPRTGAERLELVRRRIRILEDRLNNPEAAASALRELGNEAIARRRAAGCDAPQPAPVGAGARGGARAVAADRDGEGEGRRRLQQARLGAEPRAVAAEAGRPERPGGGTQGCRGGAGGVPDNPAALAALAQLHLKENDFASYYMTRLREARALKGAPEAVEALLDAGRVAREQLTSPDKARACFEEALRAGARERRRAAGTVVAARRRGAAGTKRARVLERQLEMTQDPAARAAVLTDLARTTWDGFSDGAGAQVYLDQALALVPDHLPAILAIADIHYKEGQWELAEKRLTEASRRLRNQPQQAAQAVPAPGRGAREAGQA